MRQFARRAQREAAIANALVAGPKTTLGLVQALYVDLNPKLVPAALKRVTGQACSIVNTSSIANAKAIKQRF